MNALTVAICTRTGSEDVVKAIEEAMEALV